MRHSIILLASAIITSMPVGSVHAQTAALSDAPLFHFPLEVGNVWVYREYAYPECGFNGACHSLRLSVVDHSETANAACGLIQVVTSRTLYHQFQITGSHVTSVSELVVCQAGNQMYLYQELEELTGDFQDRDMIADFDRNETQPWLIAHDQQEVGFPYKLRRLIERNVMFPYGKVDYVFMTYLAENEQDLEGISGNEFVESPPNAFTSGIGFPYFVYGPLRGYYLNGVLTGDTTTVHATSIDRHPEERCDERPALIEAYPNPFNPRTVVSYQLSVVSDLQIEVFNPLGQRVAVLFDWIQIPGSHSATFDASGLPSGVYVVLLRAGDATDRRLVTLLK